ncbi:hypothetical protein AB0C33_01385 [Nonomuraea sp. NPDC048881]|uniref:hypothetical protein n=1 Tax=Nonomuraea sp. NPDC048881 TaxID=3155030 RepID=UPI0033EE1264
MAEPKKQTFKLVYNTGPVDTSTPEVSFMGSMFSDTLEKVMKWIDDTDPESIKLAGLYYTRAETLLNGFAGELKAKAAELAKNYTGPAAVETQKQLQTLHASVRELARKLGEMGRPVHAYGETLNWAQANVVESMDHDSRTDRDVDWAGRVPFYRLYRGDKRAVEHLKKVNERIVEHYKQLPVEVQTALPDPSVPELPDFNNGGGGVPGAPDLDGKGGAGNIPVSSIGPDAVPGGPGYIDGKVPGDGGTGAYPAVHYPDGSGTNGSGVNVGGVQGYDAGDNPYGGADSSALNGASLGSTPPVSTAGLPSGTGDDTANLAGYDPPMSGMPNSAFPTTTGGSPYGGGAGSGAGGGFGAAGVGGGGAAGAAMYGAGGGSGFVAPGMMGGMPARGGESGEKHDSENSTWLAEDDDVWGGPEGTTPSTLT